MDGGRQFSTESFLTARQRAAELIRTPLIRRRAAMIGGALFILLAGFFVLDRGAYVSTSDARIAADMTAVSTDISGRITSLPDAKAAESRPAPCSK